MPAPCTLCARPSHHQYIHGTPELTEPPAHALHITSSHHTLTQTTSSHHTLTQTTSSNHTLIQTTSSHHTLTQTTSSHHTLTQTAGTDLEK